MSFLKLGDLIDGGHPVTVGDDGTVFTRLNMGQLVDSVEETTTSTQDICVDDLPIDFLSDSSFASLANDIEMTVINFDDCQKEGSHVIDFEGYQKDESTVINFLDCQKDVSTAINFEDYQKDTSLVDSEAFQIQTSPEAKCDKENNTTSFLDLDDYQFACASNELLESCLEQATNEKECDVDGHQYIKGGLFTTNLEDPVENVATAELYQSEGTLDAAHKKDDEFPPISEPIPNYSRVLFDIGNLSCGVVPEHQGFIKLTPEDCIPASQDTVGEDLNLSTRLQAAAADTSILSNNFDGSLVFSSAPIGKIEPENLKTPILDSGIGITLETFEIEQAPKLNPITLSQQLSDIIEQEFFGSAINDMSTTLQQIDTKAKETEQSNEYNLVGENNFEPKTTAVEPIGAKHKCTEPNCDELFSSLFSQKRHCSLVHGLSWGIVPEHQGFIKLFTEDCIPAAQDSFVEDLNLPTHIETAATDNSRLNDGSLTYPSTLFSKLESKDVETPIANSEIDAISETGMLFEIGGTPLPNAIDLPQQLSEFDKEECFSSDSNDLSTILELISPKTTIKQEEESNDCNSELGDTFETDTVTEKTSSAKHKCPEPDCDESFPSLSSAKRHRSLIHGPFKPFYCTIDNCGIAFRFASYLARHIRSKHDGIRDHECTECGHRFLTSRDLAVHKQKHTGERPVPCQDPGCDMTFSARSIADTHFLVKHKMMRQHVCEECGKAFGTLSNLREHSVTHTGAKDFPCEVSGCGKAFQTKGKLKRHGLSHTKVRPFQCEQCDRSFRLFSMLNVHVAKKHNHNASNV